MFFFSESVHLGPILLSKYRLITLIVKKKPRENIELELKTKITAVTQPYNRIGTKMVSQYHELFLQNFRNAAIQLFPNSCNEEVGKKLS